MTSKRLSEYIEYKKISYYAFENSIEASRGSISKAASNGKSIGSNVIENILLIYTDLNPIWLLTGKGAMLIPDNKEQLPKKELEEFSIEDINTHIFKHISAFKQNESFQLLIHSLDNENQLHLLKSEIDVIKQKLESLSN